MPLCRDQEKQDTRIRPSDLILDVTGGGGGSGNIGADACETPRIVDFFNLEDNTSAVSSTVRLDEPLFQPYPSKVIFEGYDAFGQQEKVSVVVMKAVSDGFICNTTIRIRCVLMSSRQERHLNRIWWNQNCTVKASSVVHLYRPTCTVGDTPR